MATDLTLRKLLNLLSSTSSLVPNSSWRCLDYFVGAEWLSFDTVFGDVDALLKLSFLILAIDSFKKTNMWVKVLRCVKNACLFSVSHYWIQKPLKQGSAFNNNIFYHDGYLANQKCFYYCFVSYQSQLTVEKLYIQILLLLTKLQFQF